MEENSCGEEGQIGVAMRWTTDPGAIPGEPYDYLDIPVSKNGEMTNLPEYPKARQAEIDCERPFLTHSGYSGAGGRAFPSKAFPIPMVPSGTLDVSHWPM